MTAVASMVTSAAIMLALGVAHLVLTFRGPKLLPRDPALRQAMERVHPVITTQTTMWRAWIGFNASHSMGAILFGLVYGYLALAHGELLLQSVPLQAIGLAMLAGYALLATPYWFITPQIGIGVALASYVFSIVMAWT